MPSSFDIHFADELEHINNMEALITDLKSNLKKAEQVSWLEKGKRKKETALKTQTNKKLSDKVETNSIDSICICGKNNGKAFKCTGTNCSRKWFHPTCLDMKVAPKGKWMCDLCLNAEGKQLLLVKRKRVD